MPNRYVLVSKIFKFVHKPILCKMNWYARFQAMVKELSQHPEVMLLDFHVFEPLENSQIDLLGEKYSVCLLYTSPSPRDATLSRMPSSA